MFLQVLVLVLGGGQQAGDVADAFGYALSEQQLGAEPQVLRVFDEAEEDDSALASAKLYLQQGQGTWLHRVGWATGCGCGLQTVGMGSHGVWLPQCGVTHWGVVMADRGYTGHRVSLNKVRSLRYM